MPHLCSESSRYKSEQSRCARFAPRVASLRCAATAARAPPRSGGSGAAGPCNKMVRIRTVRHICSGFV